MEKAHNSETNKQSEIKYLQSMALVQSLSELRRNACILLSDSKYLFLSFSLSLSFFLSFSFSLSLSLFISLFFSFFLSSKLFSVPRQSHLTFQFLC